MTSPTSLEHKVNNSGCASCFIYPALIIPIVFSIWSCGYIIGKYYGHPEPKNQGLINNDIYEKQPYKIEKEKVDEPIKK